MRSLTSFLKTTRQPPQVLILKCKSKDLGTMDMLMTVTPRRMLRATNRCNDSCFYMKVVLKMYTTADVENNISSYFKIWAVCCTDFDNHFASKVAL